MNAFSRFFAVYLSIYVKTKSFLVLLVLLPISVIAVAVLSENYADEVAVSVAVCLGEQAENGDEILTKIKTTLEENDDIDFVFLQDSEELYDKIKTEEVVVGYILQENFSERIANLDYDEIVKRVNLENNPYAIFVDRIVLSTIFDALIPYISQKQLADLELYYDISDVEEQVDFYDKDGFSVEISYMNGEKIADKIASSDAFAVKLIYGIISLYLLVISLSAAAFCADKKDSSSLFSPFLGRTKLQFYKLTPVFFLAYIFAIISLIVAFVRYKNADINLAFDIVNLTFYQISLLISSVLVSKYVKKEVTIVLIPFVIVFAVVTHPILIDITTFLPVIKPILQIFPSYNYLLCDFNSILRMLIISVLMFFIANGFFIKRKK